MPEISKLDTLSTVRDFIRWGASRFGEAELYFGHGTDNALDEAAYLVLHALHLPPDIPSTYLDGVLTPRERQRVLALLDRRVDERIPASYLTGEAWFAGLPFCVDERVLIPRSPFAELIEVAFQPWIDPGSLHRVLDLCTGSGCIGITCALAFPNIRVDIADISAAALEVAAHNVERHQCGDRIEVLLSDLFDGIGEQQYELIVSNPPYVSHEEMRQLPPEYQHEPALGLAAGVAGLDIVARILRDAGRFLTPDGALIVEVGNSQLAVMERWPTVPFTWLEFEFGGDGVFLLTAEQLLAAGDILSE